MPHLALFPPLFSPAENVRFGFLSGVLKRAIPRHMAEIVAALYRFTPFEDPAALRPGLEAVCRAHGIRGTLLLAGEGINGTISGPRSGIMATIEHIRSLPGCRDLEWKESTAQTAPFRKLRIKLKSEIVTMGAGPVDPRAAVGTYVAAKDWNALIRDPETVVIDTRNDYEVAIGSFAGAIDPQTTSFRDFPRWWAENAERFHNKKIAMFCTGGIRCEKSTSYLVSQGVPEVYHLKGGILKYLEEVPKGESLWEGSCFVFDERVSVEHGLQEGPHILCRACRRPLLPEDRERPEYQRGAACHHCIDEYSEEDRARFVQRQRQIDLALERGEGHLSSD